MKRRGFLPTALAAPVPTRAAASGSLVQAGYRKLVSRADLVYDQPAARSEEGIPVGNGRMGSLVRTTPASLRLQINRVDVYANNSCRP